MIVVYFLLMEGPNQVFLIRRGTFLQEVIQRPVPLHFVPLPSLLLTLLSLVVLVCIKLVEEKRLVEGDRDHFGRLLWPNLEGPHVPSVLIRLAVNMCFYLTKRTQCIIAYLCFRFWNTWPISVSPKFVCFQAV